MIFNSLCQKTLICLFVLYPREVFHNTHTHIRTNSSVFYTSIFSYTMIDFFFFLFLRNNQTSISCKNSKHKFKSANEIEERPAGVSNSFCHKQGIDMAAGVSRKASSLRQTCFNSLHSVS